MVLCCVPIICVAVYYTPLLASLGWHVMHGMAINYRGLRVRVPFGWIPDLTPGDDDFPASPQGVTIEKQPKTLGFESAGPELMYFNVLLPDEGTPPDQQVAQWQDLFRSARPASRFDVASLANLPSGMDCLQATPHSSPLSAILACISLKDGWVARFAGSEAHVRLFLDIAADLKSKR